MTTAVQLADEQYAIVANALDGHEGKVPEARKAFARNALTATGIPRDKAVALVEQALEMYGALETHRPDDDGFRIFARSYAEIEPTLTDWVWEDRIPRGGLSLFVGTEGLGKTAVGLAFVADLTRGRLPGCFEGEPVNVAMLTPEDNAGATIRKRLDAANADVGRVYDFALRKDEHARGLSLPGDTHLLVNELRRLDVRFVFVDPMASILDPRINTWSDTDIRAALEPLVAACEEHDITVVGTLHTNKKASTNARERGMGSAGWRQLARATFVIGLDPDDPNGADGSARCIGHDKHNLGPWTRTFRFALETVGVPVAGTVQQVVRAVLGEACDVTTDQMLAAEQGFREPEATAEGSAKVWLTSQLEKGPVAMQNLRVAAERDGKAWRTVERAKKDLGVESKKTPNGWVWTMSGGLEF